MPTWLRRRWADDSEDDDMSNLTIANIMLFFAILCMTLSAATGMTLFFVYSIGATTLAGAVRHQQLPHDR
jgi:hypothetical protein